MAVALGGTVGVGILRNPGGVAAALVIILTSVGTFEFLLGIATFFVVVLTILTIIALFVLRRREPDTPRPFRTWGYPFAPLLMLVFAVLLFFGFIIGNPYPSLYALAALAASYPIFRLINKDKLL